MAKTVLYPGNTLGIIGLDHNGRAMIAAAHELGLKVHAYVNQPHPELTAQADYTIVGNYRDKDKLTEFGEACDAVVYVTAAIDAIVFKYLSQYTRVIQGVEPLEILQDRLMQRAFLDQVNVNIAPYVTVISLDDVYQAIDSIGYPAVLKPIQRGVGDESMIIRRQSDIARAANFMQAGTYLLESWIDHAAEYALTVAVADGKLQAYPLAKLDYTADRDLLGVTAPVTVASDLQEEMMRITEATVKQLGYQGILTVEFYVTESGNLYVKGIEPGLIDAGNVFETAASLGLGAQMVRIAAGMPAQPAVATRPTILMLTRTEQLKAVMRQQVLKDNWRFAYFLPEKPQENQVVGFTWLAAFGDQSMKDLADQLDATSVWELPETAAVAEKEPEGTGAPAEE